MELAKEKQKFVNGVNVDALFGTMDAIKETPAIAEFKFRANNKWVNGRLAFQDFSNFSDVSQFRSSNDKIALAISCRLPPTFWVELTKKKFLADDSYGSTDGRKGKWLSRFSH